MAITVKCKKCSKAYKVGDDKAGKKFKCRQCSAPIKIPDLEIDDFMDDLDDDSDGEFAEYTPATRKRPKSKPKKKTKKSSSNSNQTLLVVGAIGAMLLIGIAGFFILGSDKAGNSLTEKAGNNNSPNSKQEKLDPVEQMKLIALGFHNFHDTYTRFPPADAHLVDGKPLLSWRVHMLPQLGHAELYKQFNLKEPWDSPHNSALLEKIPNVFYCDDVKQPGYTSIMTFSGKGTPFQGGPGPQIRHFTDGTSNTILFVKAGPDKAVPWTKPVDLPFDANNPLSVMGQSFDGVFITAAADGSIRKITTDMPAQTIKNLIQHRDGNPL